MSLTIVGSIGLDTIQTPFGGVAGVLGGSAAYFTLAAALYQSVNVVSVVGADLPAGALDSLAARGADLSGVAHEPGPTFRWGGRYQLDLNSRETLFTELGVLGGFAPVVPPAFRDAPVVFMANLQPDVQSAVVAQTPHAVFRALDTMNFWITGARADLDRAVSQVDLVFMAEDEARLYAGEANTRAAGRAILARGPRSIVIKLGSYGALWLDREGHYFAAPAFPLDSVRDPTGAGDAFAGGFMGYLAAALARRGALNVDDFKRALLHGNILGAFACEAFGVDRLTTLTRQDVLARYRDLLTFTHVELAALEAAGDVFP